MTSKIDITKILFLDIETVPIVKNYDDLNENFKKFWDKKSQFISSENESSEDVFNKAGIYSEFGKIICISVGFIDNEKNKSFRLKSFFGDDEKKNYYWFFFAIRQSF